MAPGQATPLKGLRIVVTRERGRASEMAAALERLGASAVVCPMITFLPPMNWKETDDALARLGTFSWAIFTSMNSVCNFIGRLKERGISLNEMKKLRIACVGEATAGELRKFSLAPDYIPEEQSSEELLQALSRMMRLSGQKLLLPRGDLASPLLREGLRKQGALVLDPVVYRNVPDPEGAKKLREEVERGVDVICFSSPSAAVNAAKALGEDASKLLSKSRCYSIGPLTSKALRELGVEPRAEARPHDMPGLIEAVVLGEGRG